MRSATLGAAVVAVLVPVLASCSSSGTASAGDGGTTRPASGSPSMRMSMSPGASMGSSASMGSGSSKGQTITVHTTDSLRFKPSTIRVHTGTVKIKLVNDGSYPHNLVSTDLHAKSDTVNGDPGSDTTTMTLHFDKAGTYPFVCTYHASSGMKGQFVVTK